MVLSNAVIMFLSRPGLYKLRRTFSRMGLGGLDAESAASPNSPPKDTPFSEFTHTSTLVLKFDLLRRYPCMFRRYKDGLLMVVYNDGIVQLIQFSPELIQSDHGNFMYLDPTKPISGKSFLLCEFQTFHHLVNDNQQGKDESIQALFDASGCETYGSNAYIQEVFTVGKDLRILHFGLRYHSYDENAVVAVAESTDNQSLPDQASNDGTDESIKIYTEEVTVVAGKQPVAADYLGVSPLLFSGLFTCSNSNLTIIQ